MLASTVQPPDRVTTSLPEDAEEFLQLCGVEERFQASG
ncbi:hypothetical protein GN958_ATG16105 [Phytophthora infestans]|uniref:Uncharacterized protein n=1 Tax=Phytophthora infestans TaxID=4787 RepID=A0A8S9U6I9_PHYIN|nr:hypothetical protein GN958_ATG16105 [Phytophthora infestans]